MFLIHLMACDCGSTMSGHLVPRVTITPFSVEKGSLGIPWMFQSRTTVGLAMKSIKLTPGVWGTCSFLIWTHFIRTPSVQRADSEERASHRTLSPPSQSYSPISFQSDHLVVMCPLVKCRIVWVWCQQSNESTLPHLTAASISHHQWIPATAYFEGSV